MNRYRLAATLLAPMVVRRERQSQRSEGATHITGTVVRGAFAFAWMAARGLLDGADSVANSEFRQLFLDEVHCRFGPWTPAKHILPLTAVSCKRNPGFVADGGHGVWDTLPRLIRYRLRGDVPAPSYCPVCKQDLRGFVGKYWEMVGNRAVEGTRKWQQFMAPHIGIDRCTETAAESIFYSLPAIEPMINAVAPPNDKWPNHDHADGAHLYGWIDTTPDRYDLLCDLLRCENGILRIGHARTRGYGKVLVTFTEDYRSAHGSEDANGFREKQKWWGDWSSSMARLVWGENSAPPGAFVFSLTLPTGAILVDRYLRYTLDLHDMVAWLPPLPQPGELGLPHSAHVPFQRGLITCLAAVTGQERLRGWNVAWGLPRHDEWLVTPGAVYAYQFTGPEDDLWALQEGLASLEQRGVGLRRNEGYGEVQVCDRFHVTFPLED